jgi:GT2 family glycosyltransferase
MYPVLRRVLDGYDRQDAPDGSFEVVVVADIADPDPDAIDAAIGERTYPVRRITGHMPGLSANRNAGRRAAGAPLVLFTDNDTIPVARLVSEHLEWHRRHPEEHVGVLGHVRWAPELRVTPFMRWLEQGIQFDYPNIQGIEAGWGRFYGANVSVKRGFAERVGDFEEERLPYGYEDLEWSHRASKLGFRLLYDRRAVVDHLRPMTLEFWQRRVRRIAVAERQFVQLHPEIAPWFHGLFTSAARRPPARGRGVGLARYVPPWVPWLGPRVWASADIAFKQALAPHFLEAWAECRAGGAAQPDLSERDAESTFSLGPK